ncbi:MAG: putative ABC transporter permease subunit [Clostridium sp.]
MNNLISILKIKLITSLNINKVLKEKSGSIISKIAFIILCGAAILFGVGIYINAIAEGLKQLGILDLFLYVIPIICIAFCLFTSIYKAQGVLFSSKDTELLTAMPIKESTILSSKIIELMVLNYFFLLAILLPTSVVYYIHLGSNPIFFFLLLVGFIFIPLLPIVIATIISIALGYISSKFRFKNIAYIGLYILLFGGLFVGLGKLKASPDILISGTENIISTIKTFCPPAYYFTDMLINTSMSSLLMLVLWSIVPFILFIAVFKKIYKRVTAILGESYKGSKLKKIEMKASGHVLAILKKEFRRYISSPLYVINTAFGVVLMTALSGVTLFGGEENLLAVVDLESLNGQLGSGILALFVIVALTFTTVLMSTTASSISLEGKNIWILQSMPIKPIDIFLGKGLLNFAIYSPFIIINSIIFVIALKLSIIDLLWAIIIPMCALIISSLGGLIINLNWPNLKWTNEVQVIKQSFSIFLSLILGIAIPAIPFGLFLLLKPENMNLFLICILIIYVALGILSYYYLNTIGSKKFNRL